MICFITENVVGCLCEKYNENRIYVHDAFMILCLLATISVWRGLWMIMDQLLGEKLVL